MKKHVKGLIGPLILSALMLNGCRLGSSSADGACGNPSTCHLTSVAYGAGVFVAVGSGGELRADLGGEPWIETSTDGINWTPQNIQYTGAQLNQAYMLQSIAYGENGFVTTDGVHVLHSGKGLNWTIDSFESTSNQISYVIYDGTRYILYSNTTGPNGAPSPGVASMVDNFPWKVSTDGVNWTDYGNITVTNGPPGEPASIIHVAGMYEAAWQPPNYAPEFLTATSTDGLSWTLGPPMYGSPTLGIPTLYGILHTGDQYILFGGTDWSVFGQASWGVALYGPSMSAVTMVGPLRASHKVNFYPAGEALHGNPYEITGLVSNGTVTVGLGEGGLFVTTDGITWKFESLEGVVPDTGCTDYSGNECTAFASGAAAPGGSIVVLTTGGTSGAETTDGVHWVKSNLY